ncbi:MAG: mechanosensitive ion channel family protein [Acidobacteriaceae bacterium]|nr:mechanosensitive ion channel family protein [Acidobacteriaceae bacterium]
MSCVCAAQPIVTGSSQSANAAPDALGRETPRSSIRGFLEACHDGKYVRATGYLDLSRLPKNQRTTEGPELARQLGILLDRDMDFEVEDLSSTTEGQLNDGLDPDLERLARFRENGRAATLYLQRQEHNGNSVWVVSADSVSRIPQWSSLSQGPAIEKRLPPWLVETRLFGTALWVWIALAVLALLLSVVSKLLSRIVISLVKPVARRYAQGLQAYRLESFTEPLRLLLSVAVFRACMEAIGPSALLREYLLGLLALLAVFGLAALLMRVVDVVSDRMTARLDPRQRALSYSVLPLGVRFVKICIFCLALLIVLDQWGLHITTILAGVGVGGLAVALAAQKTIENLFGGISVISDRPVLVGDVCQFGGQTGVVEDIGLRSTRIRTAERTLVTIPNAQFSTMTLENLSRRDRMLFKPVLQLHRDTSPDQVRAMMQRIEQILRDEPKVDPTEVPVRFTKIVPEAYTLEVFAYVLTSDGSEYLRQQSRLLLKMLDAAAELGVRFAVPFQESVTAAAAQAGQGGPGARDEDSALRSLAL